jgi:hypothetical protein
MIKALDHFGDAICRPKAGVLMTLFALNLFTFWGLAFYYRKAFG